MDHKFNMENNTATLFNISKVELERLWCLVHIAEQCAKNHNKTDMSDDAKQVIRDLNKIVYNAGISDHDDIER